ncbi:predicted protein [Sclerotinia sclerotiorum 1980 UF-70]|uniref:Uncharacterized protein n=1 Tax=Sclerotinia sclerotiorum (strain ATCC 18683 / 1980 / Ss-1) TaxID=665079 RepID=A7EQB7_SCLS1|nr:predicted protein [Sclerotinia sclerotiorum 1980 UF-70]EDO05033.1 predicted protein [Sclerotinia sclerotiorum 1980 UF-70]
MSYDEIEVLTVDDNDDIDDTDDIDDIEVSSVVPLYKLKWQMAKKESNAAGTTFSEAVSSFLCLSIGLTRNEQPAAALSCKKTRRCKTEPPFDSLAGCDWPVLGPRSRLWDY